MTKASKRRRIAARARYRNRLSSREVCEHVCRWIIEGYRLDHTWFYIRRQGHRRG